MVNSKRIGNFLSVLVMGGSLLAGGMMISQSSLAQDDAGGAKKGGGKGTTMEGVVSDTMCAGNHNGKDAAKCTAGCVKKGSTYSLIVGDKAYELSGKLDGIDKLAGAKAKVTGKVDGDKMTVRSVEPAS